MYLYVFWDNRYDLILSLASCGSFPLLTTAYFCTYCLLLMMLLFGVCCCRLKFIFSTTCDGQLLSLPSISSSKKKKSVCFPDLIWNYTFHQTVISVCTVVSYIWIQLQLSIYLSIYLSICLSFYLSSALRSRVASLCTYSFNCRDS